jgi:tetratricopeptide (TPR) repeat protein
MSAGAGSAGDLRGSRYPDGTVITRPRNQEEFERLRDEYLRIFDDHGPAAALDFVNGLGLGHSILTAQIRAAAFTDCGTALRSPEIVACGERLWRRLCDRTGDRAFMYNLANALLGRWEVDLRRRSLTEAWEDSQEHLREARTLYLAVAEDGQAVEDLRLQSTVNVANSYDTVGRIIEAIDACDLALTIRPRFAMALGNRGIAMKRLAQVAPTHAGSLHLEAWADLAGAVNEAEDVIRYGGRSAVEYFERALSTYSGRTTRDLPAVSYLKDGYARWCQLHGLTLHLSPRCIRKEHPELDPLWFRSVTSSIGDRYGEPLVPEIFSAFNGLKQEFATSRLLAWIASADTSVSSVLRAADAHTRYLDTLDYARYDAQAGIARQAFQAGNNLLDKIAAVLQLLLGIEARRPQFRGWWRVRPSSPKMEIHPKVRPHLEAGNLGLWALCDLSADLEEKGRYRPLQQLREAATHRIVIQHDIGAPGGSSDMVVHVGWDDFADRMRAQLRVAKAALVYLVEAIDTIEAGKREGTSATAPMQLRRWIDYRPASM